ATVSSQYGSDIIYLFLGGFILAIAMDRWDLHTRIALTNISSIGTSTGRILLGFMVVTGGLSMFVSNTASVMIMIPIGLAFIKDANVCLLYPFDSADLFQ
ncbi:SLC13 family permease, partial [Staphylococcus pseudintermedius]|uniref:SLC13 family permease n=1 Tax=Staphylococcus pseudintermedius TaxID=283734 RepID=UPI000E39B1B7